MRIQPPWTFREFLENALRGAEPGEDPLTVLVEAAGVWPDFDKLQRQEWREYQEELRERMSLA